MVNRPRKTNRYGAEATVRHRLSTSTHSATCSYRRSDGIYATIIGYGDTLRDRVRDADAQLPAGQWLRTCVSTPTSIYGDLVGRDPQVMNAHGSNEIKRAYPLYEMQMVKR